jgi:hypothetical protein
MTHLVPAHSTPPQLARQQRRARLRRPLNWRVVLPGLAFGLTDLILAGDPAGRGSFAVMSAAVHVAAGVGALVATMLIASAAKIIAASRAREPRRWHYVVLSAGYLGCAGCIYGAGADALAAGGWMGNVTAVLLVWSLTAAVAMLGRAMFRGRSRRLFWWYRPPWLDSRLSS